MAKSRKQQAAIAISMKAAGKKPKMQMGGPTGKKLPTREQFLDEMRKNKKPSPTPSKSYMDAISSGNRQKITDYMNNQRKMRGPQRPAEKPVAKEKVKKIEPMKKPEIKPAKKSDSYFPSEGSYFKKGGMMKSKKK